MKIEQVPIDRIVIGERYRTDWGDLETLAQSIRDIGLLHAIGINQEYKLIFGFRRLEACADILKWETIPCVIFNLDSILAGEYAENEFRKQFTPSERVAISEALEREEFKKQQGKRTDLLPDNYPEVREETRSKVARAAGFESEFSMRQARKVVARGASEVIAAMDSEELSISAAATIVSQPTEDQRRIVAMPKDERRTAIRDARKTKAEREANEQRARDLRLFRGLHNAVEFIAGFYEDPQETWAGLSRVSAYEFSGNLDKAIRCLVRIQKVHPNERQQFEVMGRKAGPTS